MSFVFSRNSRTKLAGVHPKLVAVAERALTITKCDFSVIDGLREYAVQVKLFKTGASKTLKSKHLKQPDGYGHAIDFLPARFKDSDERWNDTEGFNQVAAAFKQAAFELGVSIRWGGDWDGDGKTRAQGDKDEKFVDLPHVELRAV